MVDSIYNSTGEWQGQSNGVSTPNESLQSRANRLLFEIETAVGFRSKKIIGQEQSDTRFELEQLIIRHFKEVRNGR